MTTTVLTPADVLRGAADWLAEDPAARWTQGEYIGPDNCRCALGAVAYVLAPLDVVGNPAELVDPEKAELGAWVMDFLASYLVDEYGVPLAVDSVIPADGNTETVAGFNDSPDTSAADVIAALRGAADEWDARRAARVERAS